MIRASVYGRLGGDPVERTTRSDKAMITANVAVNAARWGEDEDTEWISLAAFGKAGEALARHSKGDLIAVMGQMTRSRFTGRDGAERENWQLTVDAIVSARTARPGGGRKPANRATDGPRPAERQPQGDQAPFDDDLPV